MKPDDSSVVRSEKPAVASTRDEVLAILEADETRLGDVYRLDRDGKNYIEIAAHLGVETAGFVSIYKAVIAALLDGVVPSSATISAQAAARVRTWLKKPEISSDLRSMLERLNVSLQARADDTASRVVEDDVAKDRTEQVERVGTPGIYVYTLPHYIRHPYEPDTGRTLLKVGRSERDTYARAHSQGRITALPEDPILLRVYKVDPGDTARVESGSTPG